MKKSIKYKIEAQCAIGEKRYKVSVSCDSMEECRDWLEKNKKIQVLQPNGVTEDADLAEWKITKRTVEEEIVGMYGADVSKEPDEVTGH